MSLSADILLGSLLVTKSHKGDWRTCAIGMAQRANGMQIDKMPESIETDIEIIEAFRSAYKWLVNTTVQCPACSLDLAGNAIVAHPFDQHVCNGEMTIEQLADFIATIEPPEPKPVPEITPERWNELEYQHRIAPNVEERQ